MALTFHLRSKVTRGGRHILRQFAEGSRGGSDILRKNAEGCGDKVVYPSAFCRRMWKEVEMDGAEMGRGERIGTRGR
ncbi:MAG: hypothetical protein J6T02_03925, partial [Bacteroidales bacterium]|nr:hypothetical protein [Bacteroidales bacterium]